MQKIKLRKKHIFSGLGIVILSAAAGVLYFVYKKMKKVKLTKWMEDYIEEIKFLIKSDNFKEMSLETISRIIHLQKEIADYFFEYEYYEVEDKRLNAFDSPYSGMYDIFVGETVEAYNKCMDKAKAMLEKSLSIKYKELEGIKEKHDGMRVNYAFKKYRKLYYNLPNIKREKLIECYIDYATTKKRIYFNDLQDIKKMRHFHHYSNIASLNIYRNKYKLKDQIKVGYNLDIKYLDQLVNFHKILEIPKVRYFYEELINLQEYV